MTEQRGRRVYVDGDGRLSLVEGDYGREADGSWSVRPPGQHADGIPEHTVEEHGDGTITVSPSIVLRNADGSEAWHGWLIEGVWRPHAS